MTYRNDTQRRRDAQDYIRHLTNPQGGWLDKELLARDDLVELLARDCGCAGEDHEEACKAKKAKKAKKAVI